MSTSPLPSTSISSIGVYDPPLRWVKPMAELITVSFGPNGDRLRELMTPKLLLGPCVMTVPRITSTLSMRSIGAQ
ncbi:MAG: hypothetical protein ACK4TP_17780 [Hyphomicrobium sp.]